LRVVGHNGEVVQGVQEPRRGGRTMEI
jgi:hypothetical protein